MVDFMIQIGMLCIPSSNDEFAPKISQFPSKKVMRMIRQLQGNSYAFQMLLTLWKVMHT